MIYLESWLIASLLLGACWAIAGLVLVGRPKRRGADDPIPARTPSRSAHLETAGR